MDCGASSLAIICRYYGKAISLARIRQLVHTGLDGTSLKAICEGANELGLAARAVKASPAGLGQLPLPAIVHWDGNHWVVLYDVDDGHVRISDPAVGKRRMTRAEFEEKWSGYAALFDYTDRFAANPEARPGIAWLFPFFRPYSQPAGAGGGARADREPAADGHPRLHPGHRRSRAGRARRARCSTC